MQIQELKKLIRGLITSETTVQIPRDIFQVDNGRKAYNALIRRNIPNGQFGIYIWLNPETTEVIYIGMAGTIKSNGALSDHSLQQRLTATRGRCSITKKDILTNDYIFDYLTTNNVNLLEFHVLYARNNEPPAYLEAILLYNYFKRNNRLPILNHSF